MKSVRRCSSSLTKLNFIIQLLFDKVINISKLGFFLQSLFDYKTHSRCKPNSPFDSVYWLFI